MKLRLPLWISRSTRLAAATALPSLLLCAFSQVPAHAGHWLFTGTYSVNKSGNITGDSSARQFPPSLDSMSIGWAGNADYGGSATVTINITATWQPVNNDTPPYRSFLMTASASGASIGPYNGGETASANDGFGNNPVTNIISPPNQYTSYQSTATDRRLTTSTTFSDTLSVSQAGGVGGIGVSLTVAPDPRSAHITSYLGETTTYKGPLYTSPEVSDVYTRQALPFGNSADSIVYPVTDPITGNQTFQVSGNFYANAVNFKQPTITWKITGDGTPDPVLTVPYMSAPNPQSPYGVSTLPVGLNFGGPSWDLTKTKSTQISVKVVDTDGAEADDTYSVTWHAPQENMTTIGVEHNIPLFEGTLMPIDKNSSVAMQVTIPGMDGLIDWGDVAQKSSLPVAVAGSAAGGLLLIPEVASGPTGWGVIAFQAIATAAGATLSMQSPTHPGTVPVQATASYHEYHGDLQIQVAKNAAGDTSYPHFVPQQNAEAALAAYLDPTQWDSDPYFKGSTAQWQPGWYQDITNELADVYAKTGYTGHLNDSLAAENATFQYFKWTCTYNPPPPPQ